MLQEVEAFCRQRRGLFYPKADLPLPAEVLGGQAGDAAALSRFVTELARRRWAVSPAHVRPLGEQGTFHRLYHIDRRDGGPVIVRVNALSHLQRDFPLCQDQWVADRLRANRLPALAVHEVDLSRRLGPFDFEILEPARGQSLKALDDDDAALRPLLTRLGRLAARVHQIGGTGFGFLDLRPLVRPGGRPDEVAGLCGTWRDYVFANLDTHVRTCTDIAAISPAEARRIDAVFAAAEPLLADVRPALLHGDLGSHNVFTDGRDITALIDWEDCLFGDPVYEVAFWATFHPDRRHAAFLDGYRAEAELSADFGPRFWIYFLRVALAKTMLRHRLGLQDRPGRVPASRRIQKGLHQVETLLAHRNTGGYLERRTRAAA